MIHGVAVQLFVFVTLLIVGVLIEAFILQLSCVLYNKLTGASGAPIRPSPAGKPEPGSELGPEYDTVPDVEYEELAKWPGVPRPSLERAIRILFVTVLVNGVLTFILLRVGRLMGYRGPSALQSLSLSLVSNPLGILILGGMNALVLPTTFGRGLLIALIAVFFGILAAAFLVAIYILVVTVLGPGALRFD